MEFARILFCKIITLTLYGVDMNKNAVVVCLSNIKCVYQILKIMSVYRSVISKSQIFEKGILIHTLSYL